MATGCLPNGSGCIKREMAIYVEIGAHAPGCNLAEMYLKVLTVHFPLVEQRLSAFVLLRTFSVTIATRVLLRTLFNFIANF